MRKIREVLRLKFDAGLSVRKIATSLRISSRSAGNYLHRFNACGLTWPTALSDAELEHCLFPPAPTVPINRTASAFFDTSNWLLNLSHFFQSG